MLRILLRLNLAIAVILLSPMLVVIATALRPPSSSLSNNNNVSTTATATTTVPFSKERWNEYVAQCREVVRQPSNRPRAPPVPHDGGGAYSDQVVCFYQSRVLTLPSSSVAADTATTTTTTTGTKASDGAAYSIPSLQPMTDETLWAHIQRIEASYWNGTWEVERWKRRNRRKTSNTSDSDHSGHNLPQQQEKEDARVQGDYRTKGVVENRTNEDTNNEDDEDDNDLESYYASTFQQLDRATMVLHEPHVVAVSLHVLWSTVNYYHLLMDALLPAAEWQRHSLDQWRLEQQQQQRERQAQTDATSRQRRELNARRARWRAAGMSVGAMEQQTADFHNSNNNNNNHHSNERPPPMEVIVSGFADSIRTNRKKRLPATMAIAALLSTDQRTAIMAEGSDQRAHCFCHQVQFWANTLPRFGPRRERALRYLNRKMARSALFGRPTTEKDLVRSKDDAPHRLSTALPRSAAAADDAGPNLLPKQQQPSGEAVGSHTHSIRQAHLTERGRVCQRLARSTSTTLSSSGENSELLDRPPRHMRLLYLTRSRRKAHNEDRLLQLAAEEASLQMDVERVNFEHLTIAQQLHWIRWADVVMGVHGMQLTFIAHSIATHDYQTDSVSTSSEEETASRPSSSSSDFLAQLQEEVEDLGDEEITRVPCRTLIELYPYVHGEFLFTLHEVPKISGWSYERVVPVDVVFGPSVADPVLEKHQLMQKDFPFWNLAAFGDQNTTYAEHEVRRALKRAIQRWQSCCRVDRQ